MAGAEVGSSSSSASRQQQHAAARRHSAWPASVPQCLLLAATAAVLLLLAAHTLSLQSRAHQHHTSAGAAGNALPGQLAALPTLADLYGAWPLESSSSSSSAAGAAGGPAQLLLLSYFGSRASLVARLLMLMGVWAGDPEQLKIDPANPLRWWELAQLSSLNDMMLSKYAAPGPPHSLGRGFSAARLSREDADYYGDRLGQVLRYLNAHQPWLIKDPRLALFAPLWLERLDAPLCLLVADLQPEQLAQHLEAQAARRQQQRSSSGGQQQAGAGAEAGDSTAAAAAGGAGSSGGGQTADIASASLHMERWTNSTLSSIKACFAVPTLVVPSSVLQPSLIRPLLAVLQQHLRLAGVRGTRMPPAALLQQQFLDHLHAAAAPPAGDSSIGFCGSNGSSPAAAAAAAALAAAAVAHEPHSAAAVLHEAPCTWLPPKPRADSAGAQDAGGGSDASLLPLPTRALVEVLHDHLAATFARPDPDLQYTRVAGQLWSAYTARVAALVAAGSHPQQHPHHVLEHHSIRQLVLEALRHVEASVGGGSSGAGGGGKRSAARAA